MKKYKKYIPELCYWVILPCLGILATQVFPSIRIPFNFWGENETSNFNAVMWTLAASYLAGIFVYYLTVTHKNRNERRRRKEELGALLTETGRHIERLEKDIERSKKETSVRLKSLCPNTIYQNFIDGMLKTLDKAFLYKDILKENENEAFAEIRKILIRMIDSLNLREEEGPDKYNQEIKSIKINTESLQKSIGLLLEKNIQDYLK